MNPTVAFVLVGACLVTLALACVLPALLRSGRTPTISHSGLNAGIYRQELEDLERDHRLGLVGDVEAQSAAEELRRRLLADVALEPVATTRGDGRGAALAVATALPLGAILLYLAFGTPGALERPSPSAVPAAVTSASIEDLEAHLRSQPGDARAWVMLARAHMERDAFATAAEAYRRGMAASPKVARDAGVLCEYADALAMEQGGRLRGRPAELIAQALTLDERHPQALEMAGSAAYEHGDYGTAVLHWQRLLEQLQPGSDRYRDLTRAIELARSRANVSS
jgi:cytochrome c-type biogenesis protein CcmH